MIRRRKDLIIFLNDLEYLLLATCRMLNFSRRPTRENLEYLKDHYIDALRRSAALGDRKAEKNFSRVLKKQGCRKQDVRRLIRMTKRSVRRLCRIWSYGEKWIDTLVIMPR